MYHLEARNSRNSIKESFSLCLDWWRRYPLLRGCLSSQAMLTAGWLKFPLQLICLLSVSVWKWSPQQACHPSAAAHPCSASTARWQHCGSQCNAHCTGFLYPLQSWFKFLIFLAPSYLCPLLNTFVLLGTLKEAGHIPFSHASYRRSLEGTHDSGGRAGKPWRWQRRSLEKFL